MYSTVSLYHFTGGNARSKNLGYEICPCFRHPVFNKLVDLTLMECITREMVSAPRAYAGINDGAPTIWQKHPCSEMKTVYLAPRVDYLCQRFEVALPEQIAAWTQIAGHKEIAVRKHQAAHAGHGERLTRIRGEDKILFTPLFKMRNASGFA